jgi:RimJ/RimL family protein N-acetyltransferase
MIELSAFEAADGRVLMPWINSPAELLTWAGPSLQWPLDERQFDEYAAGAKAAGRRNWTAWERSTGAVVGHISLRIDAEQESGRIGRVLVSPEARGRGYGAEMLKQVLTVAFDELGLETVELGVWAHNTSAVRLYERLGFVCHEVLPDVETVDGQPWTALQMNLPKEKWEATSSGR